VFVALALHLACLVLLAAGGIGGGFLHLVLTRLAWREPRQAVRVARIGARVGMVASSAALLMLASGVALLAARGWDDLGQPWRSAQLAIFALLFLNGVLVARPNGARLGAALLMASFARRPRPGAMVEEPLRRMGMFHALQSAGVVTLILIGVFGPR
jgi:hypothetical protein